MLLVENRELLDGFRVGRPEALKTVYLHYHPRVSQYLRSGFSFKSGERWLRFRGHGGVFDCDQAAHEALARAFRDSARSAYDGLRPFGDYLFAIARNVALNAMRRPDLLVPVGAEADLDPAAAGAHGGATAGSIPEAEPTLEEREVERLLGAFVASATPIERRLFELRFRQEMGQVDAAREMGITRIVLRRAEYKLKKRLLGYLKQNGYLEGVSRSVLGAGLRSVLL